MHGACIELTFGSCVVTWSSGPNPLRRQVVSGRVSDGAIERQLTIRRPPACMPGQYHKGNPYAAEADHLLPPPLTATALPDRQFSY
jgi:hypothetical protein